MPVVKPVFTATATAPVASGGAITTTVSPTVTRFFATITAAMIGATDITIPAGSFVDDTDTAVTALPALTGSDFFNVYVNGVIQQQSLSTLTTASLVLATTDISAGVPVQLEVNSFGDVTSTITTQPIISAPTITITT